MVGGAGRARSGKIVLTVVKSSTFYLKLSVKALEDLLLSHHWI